MQKRVRRECTSRTPEIYQWQGGYVLRRLGTRELPNLTRNLIEDTMHEIADRGGAASKQHPGGRALARKTVRGIGFVLRGCLAYAVYRGYLPKHPMDGIKLPKLEKNRKPKMVESDEFERVLRLAAGTRQFPLIVLAEASGLRLGELCGLQWSDLDFATGVLNVERAVEETKELGLRLKPPKGGRPREFVLSPYVLEALSRWKTEQDRDRELCGAEYAAIT